MKVFFAFFVFLAIVLAIYPFVDQSEDADTLTGLPWQIEILPDGTTQVFALHIGVSRLSDAYQMLGSDMELAIVAASDELGNLEISYGHYQAGLLSGKLVLQTSASEHDLKVWRDNAAKSEYMASGLAKKYTLSENYLSQVLDEVITAITFIPAVNLDEEVILARFGVPDHRIELDGVTHFLYAAKGLDVALHDHSKEVIQYVSPASFQQLLQPLQ